MLCHSSPGQWTLSILVAISLILPSQGQQHQPALRLRDGPNAKAIVWFGVPPIDYRRPHQFQRRQDSTDPGSTTDLPSSTDTTSTTTTTTPTSEPEPTSSDDDTPPQTPPSTTTTTSTPTPLPPPPPPPTTTDASSTPSPFPPSDPSDTDSTAAPPEPTASDTSFSTRTTRTSLDTTAKSAYTTASTRTVTLKNGEQVTHTEITVVIPTEPPSENQDSDDPSGTLSGDPSLHTNSALRAHVPAWSIVCLLTAFVYASLARL